MLRRYPDRRSDRFDREAVRVRLEAIDRRSDLSGMEVRLDAMQRELFVACGPWVPTLSLHPSQQSVKAILDAVEGFWNQLVEQEKVFAEVRQATAGLALDQAVERAASHLLPIVVEQTNTYDAWYQDFALTLGAYLASIGLDGPGIELAVEAVTSGHFQSWIDPDERTATAACRQLGQAVAVADVTRDALAEWLARRDQAAFDRTRRREPVREDAHARYIDGPERARDPRRAEQMAVALDACRSAAGEPLTFALLASWQQIVLGRDRVEFRRGDAFAKRGRERYPLAPDTPARFAAALAESSSAAPVALRAARVYLDVCFFHPFDDGNARAARLALDHVLSRAGLALHTVEPIFAIARSADEGPASLAHLIDLLAGPSALLG